MATERVPASPKLNLSPQAAPAGLCEGVGTGGRSITGRPRNPFPPLYSLKPHRQSDRSSP